MITFDFCTELLAPNNTFRKQTEYEEYKFLFKFVKKTVINHKQKLVYWGAYAKIKPVNAENLDYLSHKRIVTIMFACNHIISLARFKGTVDDYGYSTHGNALYHDSLLKLSDLSIDSKVVVTINIRYACRCQSNKLHPQCEIHMDKKHMKQSKQTLHTLSYLWKKHEPFLKKRKLTEL
ncbi:MAG: hypothetical protein GY938_07775 [Ketobacter sp.]|nr:hypothetical protein [Ketobacter sp.]